MALETKLQARIEALSLSSLSPRRLGPHRSHVSVGTGRARGLQVLAFAVKRSPKRLKYAKPRFTKVSSSLFTRHDRLPLVWLPRKIIHLSVSLRVLAEIRSLSSYTPSFLRTTIGIELFRRLRHGM